MVRTPATPASKGTRAQSSTPGRPKAREEKIYVTVRVRPMSKREQAVNDQIAWECRYDNTLVLKNTKSEQSPVLYTFDRVFNPACLTEKVYEEGAKDVALSPLTGINATIFAYGQTSSGKTFTMRGIVEKAVMDIYKYIKNTPERDFVLRFSALEIYNETVTDLLNRESGPLRLLDDPEKGIIVEKLVEEVATDSNHLSSLIRICEAQRQVGETALNDSSSRSHQIIRLTVESCLRENSGCVESLIATLNLVDLAGSERSSQTDKDCLRLKEGSHINRSLLTLTTVIRKLSGGKRAGHIPYRDSKLTRLLQASLGGNSRTAVICTMSPALSQLEQTRNTLSFATSAKEVTNIARVNMEVARLEAELRSSEPPSSCLKSLLRERDLKIQQMMLEMEELKRERDLAQSELELERVSHKKQKGLHSLDSSRKVSKRLPFSVDNSPTPGRSKSSSRIKSKVGRYTTMRQSTTSMHPSLLVHEIRKLEQRQRQLGEEANRALEVLHKEVTSHRLGSQDAAETIAKLLSEITEMRAVDLIDDEIEIREKTNLKEEISRLNSEGITIASLEEQLENAQKSIDKLMLCLPSKGVYLQAVEKKALSFPLRNSTNMSHTISPCSPIPSTLNGNPSEQENKSPQNEVIVPVGDALLESCKDTPGTRRPNSVNVKKMQEMFKNAAEENYRSIRAYVTELKERVAKLQYQKQLLVCQVLELEENEASACETEVSDQSPVPWFVVFEDQRKQIIMLWHLCHVSIVHRTQFYMLFRGDPDDQMYIDVELRRLTWLEQQLAEVGNASPALLGDEPAVSVSSSIKALKQEREHLAKRLTSRLQPQELEMLYLKWEVPPGGKQRRLQLVNKLWTDPHNMQHVEDSAEVVAKLVGLSEKSGEQISKEMFQLNFVPPSDKKPWMGWNLISNLLHL